MSKEVLNRKVTDLGLFMQFFLSILLLIFCIIWLFVKSNIIANIINVILGLVFMVMGYNNYKVYKRKALASRLQVTDFVAEYPVTDKFKIYMQKRNNLKTVNIKQCF